MRAVRSAFAPTVVGKMMSDAAREEAEGFQKLSLREAGQFDRKFHTPEQKAKIARGEKK